MTITIRIAKNAARMPSTVELVTTACMSSRFFAGASTWPSSRAFAYRSRWAKKPSRGSAEKTFCQLAVSVTTASQASGMPVTQAHFALPDLISSVVQTVSATAASSWLAMPNSGKSWLMPPSGFVTPV